ncbi:MAG: conjugal transfer protein MobB [Bacteroidota bacterium]|nr:conjugal transfer protein MobB [Bacteroidota bacterium]MDP4268533.1 conjugal transfer protein MobB [Bacteroidota bacterium]
MVAKISSGSSLYGVLAYNQQKVDEEHAKVLFTNRMIEPGDGHFDIASCLRSFEPYLLANRRTEKPVLHISINPDPKDRLSDEQLEEIAQTYMDKMGYGDQPFIVYKHEDIDRRHIHIVSLRIDENGRKIDHNFEKRRSMDVCRALERQYGLIPADQKQRNDNSPLKAVLYENGDVKHQIANVIRPIAATYHFQSLKEYKALLSFYKVHVEEIRGEANGNPYRGLVYCALDAKNEKVGHPFRSSLFGKSVGVEALENRMEQSAKTIREKGLKERSRKVIANTMKASNTMDEFQPSLEKQHVSALFRINGEGRIYGVTFIDHDQKAVFNGSRLGKEFSANVFNELFGQQHLDTPKQEPQVKVNRQEPDSMESYSRSNKEDENEIAGILSMLTPEVYGTDPQEEAFARKMRRKKRRNGYKH